MKHSVIMPHHISPDIARCRAICKCAQMKLTRSLPPEFHKLHQSNKSRLLTAALLVALACLALASLSEAFKEKEKKIHVVHVPKPVFIKKPVYVTVEKKVPVIKVKPVFVPKPIFVKKIVKVPVVKKVHIIQKVKVPVIKKVPIPIPVKKIKVSSGQSFWLKLLQLNPLIANLSITGREGAGFHQGEKA